MGHGEECVGAVMLVWTTGVDKEGCDRAANLQLLQMLHGSRPCRAHLEIHA